MNTAIERSARHRMRPIRPMAWWPAFAIVAAAATGYVWLRPVSHDVTVPKSFNATYNFDYSASALSAAGVYAGGVLSFGDPVFLSVVDVVDVVVDFGLEGADAQLTDGALTTRVVVASDSGWSRVLYERADVPFTGNDTSASLKVDFGYASRSARSLALSSGIEGHVTVTVLAQVDGAVTLPGRVEGGNERPSVTGASLVFDLDENSARLHGYQAPSPEDQLGQTVPGTASATSLSTQGPATQSVADVANAVLTRPTTLSIFKWDAQIDQLRKVGIVLTAVFLLFTLFNALLLWRAGRRSEVEYLDLLHGTRIFPLLDAPATVRAEAVWVGSFETLVALAENAEVDILHRLGSINDSYYVFDGPRVFGYAAKRSRVSRPGVADDSEYSEEGTES
jgi:hypothetical protein